MAIPVNDFDSIEQCPQDEENPFAQISRALIRDGTISPECRWLIIYLLSNKDGWRIQVQQVVNHLKGMVGRDKVYKLFDEAIEAGYIQRIETLLLGKKRYKYRVSRSPKFKKCLLLPENQEAEIQDTENQDAKGIASTNDTHLKDLPLPPSYQRPVDPLTDWKKKKISSGYKTEDIDQALRKLAEQPLNSIEYAEGWLDKVLRSIILKKTISESPEYKPPVISKKVEESISDRFAKIRELDRLKWERQNEIEIKNRETGASLGMSPHYEVGSKGITLLGEEWGPLGWTLSYRDEEFDHILEGHMRKHFCEV